MMGKASAGGEQALTLSCLGTLRLASKTLFS